LSWGGLDVTQAPSAIPPVFSGGRMLLYAFLKDASPTTNQTTVRLSAMAPGGPIAFDVGVDPARAAAGRTVTTLAARARIRELEESPEWTSARGSLQGGRKAAGVRAEIIELSVRYGVISRETSFVAIERRDTPVTGDMQLRRIPIALTAGWGGLAAFEARSGRARLLGSPFPIHPAAALGSSERLDALRDDAMPMARAWSTRQVMSDAPLGGISRLRAWVRGADSKSRPEPTSNMVRLIELQRADGSWDLTPEFAAAIGCDPGELQSALADATGPEDEARRALATALALAWLEVHARDQREEWRLLADKARAWLHRVAARPAAAKSWADAARLLTAR
ncbi:MAG TPA: hypothetical protein VFJ02_07745, partial [Vicinamibacterales bacterium]|nr:hypothetical protein [Vicinamibacterales bacterium]